MSWSGKTDRWCFVAILRSSEGDLWLHYHEVGIEITCALLQYYEVVKKITNALLQYYEVVKDIADDLLQYYEVVKINDAFSQYYEMVMVITDAFLHYYAVVKITHALLYCHKTISKTVKVFICSQFVHNSYKELTSNKCGDEDQLCFVVSLQNNIVNI